jgi:general secretion pathway protein E
MDITFRVHGNLYQVASVSAELAPRLTTRVKVLARLDTHIRGVPQDGRMVMPSGEGTLEARVSSLPTEQGERVVMRLVRGSQTIPEVAQLGFAPAIETKVVELLAKPQGLIFVTGPVGSGKTTTLYSSLHHIKQTRGATTSIVTLEDPIELQLSFATQTQMHKKSGMTFPATLRSVLRQDPNVLMLGEIRDRETAEIAIQAALTGHLILTTVHADSASGPFARLTDLGVEPYLLASATIGALSQRLVRTLCTACRAARDPEPIVLDKLAALGAPLPPGTYYEPTGCDYCEGHGYTGRAVISELLLVDAETRQAVHERQPTRAIEEQAVARGMKPLVHEGVERARRGETSLSEVLRVIG